MFGRVAELLWRGLMVAAIATITFVVLLGVAARYGFNAPLLWTDEAARIALVWMMFIGVAELFRISHGHVAIGVITKLPYPGVAKALRVVAAVVVVTLLLGLIAGGLILANPARPGTSAALDLPMWMIYAVVPISAILSIAFVVYRLFVPHPPEGHEE